MDSLWHQKQRHQLKEWILARVGSCSHQHLSLKSPVNSLRLWLLSTNISLRWTKITPHTWQQTQKATPLTALVHTVSAESHNSSSVLCLSGGLTRQEQCYLNTTQSKTVLSKLSYSEHRCDNCHWAVLWDLHLKRNKTRKTNWIYRNGFMNETSFHKKPTVTELYWQGALIASLKHLKNTLKIR